MVRTLGMKIGQRVAIAPSVARAIDPGVSHTRAARARDRAASSSLHLRTSESLPGALVVGGDYQGLAIARSLGRRGIGVVVVDDERSISRHSRYVKSAVRVDDLRSEEATVDALLNLGQDNRLDGWLVFPTREETVAALSRNRERLQTQFRIPTPNWDVVKLAWDKRETYRLAAKLGIPAPRTWIGTSADDVTSIDGDPPYTIKPAIKERFFYATKCKAWRADSREQLEARFRSTADLIGSEEVIVQEFIPGSGENQLSYCAFFKNGQPVASMVARRLRQHPSEFGRASTFVETIEHPEVEELSIRLLRAINYYGLVEVEYKHDHRDGRVKLLDVNARTWGYHGLGQRAGVDFPYLLYADQLGLPTITEARAVVGMFWMRLTTDVPTAVVEIAHGRLDWRAYLRSLSRCNVESVFSLDDPVPAFAEIALLPYLFVKKGL